MWADFDLKYLKDPKEIYPKNICAIVTRKSFKEDRTIVAKFLANFNCKEMKLYDFKKAIEKSDDEHKTLVESWMPEEMKNNK